jgi:31-O-methyltransferase
MTPAADSTVPRRVPLRHYDPAQLIFQVRETMYERTYLRHGIEVRPGDVVLDVGANVGVAAVFFAAECHAGLVHSFEPISPLYQLLCENTAHYTACVAHNFGVADTSRRDVITYYPDAAAMSSLYASPLEDAALVKKCLRNNGVSEEEAARAVAGKYHFVELDCDFLTLSECAHNLALDQVDLLKIDVEKAELDVLRGIGEGQWSTIKQIVAEVHDERGRLAELAALLERRCFDVEVEQDQVMRGTNLYMVFARRP